MNLLAEPQYVLDLVSRHYDVPIEDIRGSTRTLKATWARHVVMYLLRHHGGLTNTAVGCAVGRDESTVSSRVKMVERVLRVERVERQRLADALADVQEPRILLAGISQTLAEARSVVKRLEAIQSELERQMGQRMARVAS